MTQPPSVSNPIEHLRQELPAAGLFRDKDWRLSAKAFPLSPKTFEDLERLGPVLQRFQAASNLIYRRSLKGSLPGWVADYLDRGKPKDLIEYGRDTVDVESLPQVIRPDLVLREEGFAITELDTVPGGIGLTGWLNQAYSFLGESVIGGEQGMVEGFASLFPEGADIVISEESGDYRPEMEWLVDQLKGREGGSWRLENAESYEASDRAIYRFFELFDLPNIPFAKEIVGKRLSGPKISAPMKSFLEEKMWLALFWMRPLREVWKREMRSSNFSWLQEMIPYGWVVDPAPLPHHAVLPGLEVQSFEELAQFSQKDRELVLKVSGFSENAWGSRGVHMAMDLPQHEWAQVLQEALRSFHSQPYVLQRFHKGRIVEHPYWDEDSGQMRVMKGRVRLCPYYFVPGGKEGQAAGKPKLSGVLATICPEDKKILHGMRDAILVPCTVHEDGY